MSDPHVITEIKEAVTIPVMAKSRIGHFVESQILEALGIDYIDESEVQSKPEFSVLLNLRNLRSHAVCILSFISYSSSMHNPQGCKPRCIQLYPAVIGSAHTSCATAPIAPKCVVLRLMPQICGDLKITVIAMASPLWLRSTCTPWTSISASFIEEFNSRLCCVNCNVSGNKRAKSCKPASQMGAISQCKSFIIFSQDKSSIDDDEESVVCAGSYPSRRPPPHQQAQLQGTICVWVSRPWGGAQENSRGRCHDPNKGLHSPTVNTSVFSQLCTSC